MSKLAYCNCGISNVAEVHTDDNIKSVKTYFQKPCMRIVHIIVYNHGIVQYILYVQVIVCLQELDFT
jgi:hypothetical protein